MRENLTGGKYGALEVIEFSHTKNHRRYWTCRCECGAYTVVCTGKLTSGQTISCGCARKGAIGLRKWGAPKKGKLYCVWAGMKSRCYNPNHVAFKYYGARNITVCDEWLHDFPLFQKWALENGYAEGLSIDRIDNDAGYSPKNCRWATQYQQIHNRRSHGA